MNLVVIEGNELVIRAKGCAPYRIELARLTGQFVEVALRQIGIEADLWS